jgi:hypothetical protein
MTENALLYALSTIAQSAAALAALIGFFGLWWQDRLRDRMNAVGRDTDTLNKDHMNLIRMGLAPDSRSRAYLEELSRIEQRLQEAKRHRTDVQATQQRLMDVLVCFPIGTLLLLAVAIIGLAFVEELHTWRWPMRGFIGVASLWLGGAPVYLVLQAAGRGRAMQQPWSHLRYQLWRVWRRRQMWPGSDLIVERLRGKWLHIRQYCSQCGWPMLQRWGEQARTRIHRRWRLTRRPK